MTVSPQRILLGSSSPLKTTPVKAREISLDNCMSPALAPTTSDRRSSEEGTRGMIESIYGSAMALAAVASRQRAQGPAEGAEQGGLTMPLMVYGYLLGNICFQGYLLWAINVYICTPAGEEIQKIYEDFREATHVGGHFSEDLWHEWNEVEKVRLCQVPLSQPVLFLVLLMIWTSHVLIDLRETVGYAYVWASLPKERSLATGELQVGAFADSGVTEAASTWVKACVFALVLAPKCIIALVLWWLGAQWLTATPSFENLVLNAVALAFITEVDETLYAALASEEVKELTTQTVLRTCTKPLRRAGSTVNRGALTMAALTLVNVLVPVLYLSYFQTVIPHYHWDLSHPCQMEIRKLHIDES